MKYIFLLLFFSSFAFAAQNFTFIQGPSLVGSTSSTATAAGTTTLTVTSNDNQEFTGATTQNVKLPVATGLQVGRSFYISNRSSGIVTVQFQDATTAQALAANTQGIFILENNGTSNGTWDIGYIPDGGAVATSIGAFGAAPNANGLLLSSNVLTMEPADATRPGGVSTGAQTFGGAKTFSSIILSTPLVVSSGGTGVSSLANFTDSSAGADGITVTGGSAAVVVSTSIAQHVADTTHSGYLNSTDWNTFNGKQASGNYITALTGDVTAAGPGSVPASLVATSNGTLTSLSALTSAATLATVGTITTGTWNGTKIDVAHGGTNAATLTNHGVLIGAGTATVTQLAAAAAGTVLAGQGTSADPSFTAVPTLGVAGTTAGSLAFAGSGSGTITLKPQAAAGTWEWDWPITAGSSGQVLTSQGGAGTAMTWTPSLTNPMTTGGDIIYGGAAGAATRLANGSSGQVLTSAGGTSAPTWSNAVAGFNYTAQTSNYGAVINDYVNCSGASFAVTLPTAVGQNGKGIWVAHNGTSLTQAYTINTTSAQTINVNGTAVASGGFIFQTQGEKALFVSNNATWEMAEHYTFSTPATWTPMFATKFTVTAANATNNAVYTNNGASFVVAGTIAAGTTLQTVGTGNAAASGTLTKSSGTGDATITFSAAANSFGTVTAVSAWWSRYSNRMKAWGAVTPGTATANLFMMSFPGAAGSPVPIDTTLLAPSNNTVANAGMKLGILQCSGGASAIYNFIVAPGTSAGVLYDASILSGTTTLTPQTSNGGITSGSMCSFDFDVAISGWQP